MILLAFGVLAWRLVDLQAVDPDRYVDYGQSQRIRSQVLAADRGTIRDRNGEELAVSLPRQTLFADPLNVTDPAGAAAVLAPLIGVEASELRDRLEGPGRFTYLARQLPAAEADEIAAVLAAERLTGIYFMDEPARLHPADDLAHSVIGTVDIDGVGLSGLEQQFGEQLTGTPGELLLERSVDGRTIPVGEHQYRAPVKGDDLVLTLDRSLQFATEELLAEQVEATGAAGGTAVVSEPSTGEILAMTTVVRTPDGKVRRSGDNRAVTSVYEPGSVMKPVTVAGALEAGVVEPATTFTVPDAYQIADKVFTDHDPHGTVQWNVSEILAHSSNIGTIKIAKALGRDGVEEAYRNFGFGAPTGLDFPAEQKGRVPPVEEWWATSIGTIPIGHGVSATPLQVLSAYNTIANGGVQVPPVLVRATEDAAGVRHPTPLAEGRRVVTPSTAARLNLMLRDVVSDGTGTAAALRGYTPAGKTGTAYKVQPGGGYQNEDGVTEYLSTFVGFAPAEDPAISVIVVIDDPDPGRGGHTGGTVAAPVFARITEFALRHRQVAPPLADRVAALLPVPERTLLEPAADSTATPTPSPEVGERGRVRAEPATRPSPSEPSGDDG